MFPPAARFSERSMVHDIVLAQESRKTTVPPAQSVVAEFRQASTLVQCVSKTAALPVSVVLLLVCTVVPAARAVFRLPPMKFLKLTEAAAQVGAPANPTKDQGHQAESQV